MTERHSHTFKDAVNRLREAPDDSDHIDLAEEAMELATTLYDVDTVTNIVWSRYPRMRQLMARATMRRDSLRGNSQLPDEVLIEIIRLAAPNPKIDQHTNLLSDPTLFQTLNDYRRVCKRWRSVIDGASTLWAFLSTDTGSAKVVQRAIAKSRDAPLVISYGAEKTVLPQFARMVIPQMHRCGALWITEHNENASHESGAASLLDTPCPHLEDLHVSFPFLWMIDIDDAARQSPMPNSRFKIWALRNNIQRIKVLSLRRVVGWGTKLKLANLRELKLSQSGFSAMRLMESLTEAPLLQSLIIEDPSLQRVAGDDEILRGIAVELAFLSRIELQAVTTSFAHTTLSKITPPSLKQLIIAISIFDVPAFSLDNLGADYRGLVRSLMEAQGSLPIPIRVENKIQRLALSDPATRRDFELSGVDLSDKGKTRCAQCIRDFIRGWSSSSDPSFTLEFGPMTRSQTADYQSYIPLKVFEALMEIEGVSKIQVGPGVVGIKQLYYQLQLSHTVVHETNQSQRWSLPQLAILEIEGQNDLDRALVRMLKGRYAAAASHGEIVLPLAFSMVKLVRDYGREPEPTIAAEIRNIIGEEHLCIEMF